MEQYEKHQPIETNQPSNQRQLIGKANINSAPSNREQLFVEAKSACKQITENDGLGK